MSINDLAEGLGITPRHVRRLLGRGMPSSLAAARAWHAANVEVHHRPRPTAVAPADGTEERLRVARALAFEQKARALQAQADAAAGRLFDIDALERAAREFDGQLFGATDGHGATLEGWLRGTFGDAACDKADARAVLVDHERALRRKLRVALLDAIAKHLPPAVVERIAPAIGFTRCRAE